MNNISKARGRQKKNSTLRLQRKRMRHLRLVWSSSLWNNTSITYFNCIWPAHDPTGIQSTAWKKNQDFCQKWAHTSQGQIKVGNFHQLSWKEISQRCKGNFNSLVVKCSYTHNILSYQEDKPVDLHTVVLNHL